MSSSTLSISKYDLYINILASFFILLLVYVIAGNVLNNGLPSYSLGIFKDATVGAYLAKLHMLDYYGSPYTASWYFGHVMDRFYPPLSLYLPYFLGKIIGSLEYGMYLLCFASFYIMLFGYFKLGKELYRSNIISIIIVAFIAMNHGFLISTFARYWEATRLLGDALIPWAALNIIYMFKELSIKRALLSASISAMIMLTSFISAIEFLILSVPLFFHMFSNVMSKIKSFQEATPLTRIAKMYVLSLLAFTAWWYIPAIAPYGLSHYFKVRAGINVYMLLLLESLQLYPSVYTAAVQLPIFLISLVSIGYFLYKRNYWKTYGFVLGSIALCLIVFLMYGQGPRLWPYFFILATLLIGVLLKDALGLSKGKRLFLTTMFLMLTVILLIVYIPYYSRFSVVDTSYIYSDEYKVSTWLWSNIKTEHVVYLMYGNNFRGNMWANVFYPGLRQVLGGYDEGCTIEAPFKYDYLVKYSHNAKALYELSMKLGVKYIIVDRKWMIENEPRAYSKFIENDHLFKYVNEINKELNSAEVYEVLGVQPKTFNVSYSYWTPWKVIGIIFSLVIFYRYLRLYRRFKQGL